MKRSFRLLSISLFLSVLSWGQDYRGRVQGFVTDPSKSAIAQATVTLSNTNTKTATVRNTDESGRYLFDFVEPGTYALTVEGSGFGKFVQENVQVLVRSDLTINASLRVGDVNQTITVADSAVELQFNTTTLSQTVDGTMLKELPVLARNPFTLALLDPAVVNRYSDVSKRNPFYQLSTTGVDVGGQTSGRNEVQIDGSPIGVGSRGSYAPPMDAVQEFTVQQNSVDAESGFSAGGVLNVGMKAGTNEYHGSLYYFGRNPKFNAVSNAFTRAPNMVRNHVGGGTIGAPILKNKLFTFFTFEKWKNRQPYTKVMTLPTDLERIGDFSRTLTKAGALRPIFDPYTTQTNAATNAVTRTPFAGNMIPASRIDATSRLFMNDIWKPNGPGDDATGTNNYRTGYPWYLDYWNFSNRTDWNITPRWKIFGRYSVIRTALDNPNYGNSPATTSDNGGLMDALNAAMDSVYTLNARTVINFRMGVVYSEDEYDSQWAKLGEDGLAKYWPGNPWYKPYTAGSPAVYYPNLNIGGAAFGKAGWWSYRPRKYSYQGSMGHDRGRHYMKFGMAYRHAYEYSQLPNLGAFPFTANLTAETYNAPNTLLYGSAWATFLLGSIDNGINSRYVSPRYTKQDQYGLFFQDDFKLNRRVTLNLGLRWEYETAPSEREGRMARYLDLSNPIPEFQSNPPVMPSQVTAITGAVKPTYNGAWIYTDGSNPGLYQAPRRNFLPRLGIAILANNKTAIRIGYARYAVPLMSVLGYSWILPSTDGYSAQSNGPVQLQGVPQGVFSNPFPASNPLVLPVGRGNGRNTNLGSTDATSWARQGLNTPMNDRFNFTVERDLFRGFKLDGTFFMNFGHDMVPEGQGGNAGFGRALNMVDPQLGYTYKSALTVPVANPFYRLPASLMPGQLRGQATVPLSTLLRPYPQYGDLTETFMPGVDNRYKALQLRVQRRFASGYSIVWGYNYNRETTGAFFNALDQYADKLTMIPGSLPRHRMTLGTTTDLPLGRGRRFGASLHPVLNAIVGGWSTSSIFMWNSGSFLRFGQLDVTGEPGESTREWSKWFDTSVFKQATPFTPRTNPYQYEGLTGPNYWSLDTTLSKNFKLTERFKLELRLEGYNLTNTVMPGNPNLTVTSPQFGGITTQVNYGREVQYTLRLHF
ncbi:MAG TPA: TonB-dependent receptor [Bryobacteraceae bacterium]|nr:TonB-dependent receptor [Bryobacteraceae bacterium]